MKVVDLYGKATKIGVAANVNISPPSKAILVNGTAGSIVNVNVTMAEDGTVILLPLTPGVVHPIEVKSFNTAGTTATDLIAFK